MIPQKLAFVSEVTRAIRDLCFVVFNIQNEEQLIKLFGLTDAQLEGVIFKITEALPDDVFIENNPKILNEIKQIFAREFIFFQAQEKWNDPRYQDDLLNFIFVFSRDIKQRLEDQHKLKIE